MLHLRAAKTRMDSRFHAKTQREKEGTNFRLLIAFGSGAVAGHARQPKVAIRSHRPAEARRSVPQGPLRGCDQSVEVPIFFRSLRLGVRSSVHFGVFTRPSAKVVIYNS